MAKPARIFSLDLGMQTVGLAEFRKLPGGGLSLHAYRETELIADPAADATRGIQVEEAVKQLAAGMGAAKQTANFCLPAQSVFARFVKLPGNTAEDVTGIIGFEAQQNVPFPIDEVVWDYQIMGAQRSGSWDVVLVAMKADQLTDLCTAVSKGGVKPGIIDLAPMAVYNAFLYNYPEADGCSLIVDIGARTTNLIFAEDGRVFSRSIPVGGNTISAAVGKEFAQDITVAERLKVEKGFVGLGGAYAEPSDPTEARVAKVVRNTMTRLHAEIARSISFYRTSQGGSQPLRVFLCGGTVSLPYMTEFFSEKLQTPVQFLNPLRNVTVADAKLAEELSPKAHTVAELVGGALRSAGECPIEINLRPPSVVREHELARRKPFLIFALVCLACALGVWGAYFHQAAKITEEVLAGVNADVSRLDGLSGRMEKVTTEQKNLEAMVSPILAAVAERSAWPAILDELGAKLPSRFIWVTELRPVSGGKVLGSGDGKSPAPAQSDAPAAPARPGQPPAGPPKIDAIEVKGLYLDIPSNDKQARIIDEFVDNLKASPAFAIGDAKVITQRTPPTGEAWAYGFTLLLPLKSPIALP